MTASERILQEIQTLPPPEFVEVWRTLSELVKTQAGAQTWNTAAALEATHSLYARFAGSKGMARLLQERARDRARENDGSRHLLRHHG